MVSRIVLLCGTLVCTSAAHAVSVEKIRNAKVAVTEDTLQPGEQEAISGGRSIMVVYMEDGTALYGRGGTRREALSVHKGEAVSLPVRMSDIQNVGNKPLHFARIEFLMPATRETWGMTGLPPAYRIVHEDGYTRAYEIRIPAGKFEPQHTHHARVVVALQGAQLEHILPDGTRQPSTLKTGEIVWREGATHVGHNMGTTDLWVIAVEPK